MVSNRILDSPALRAYFICAPSPRASADSHPAEAHLLIDTLTYSRPALASTSEFLRRNAERVIFTILRLGWFDFGLHVTPRALGQQPIVDCVRAGLRVASMCSSRRSSTASQVVL